MSTPATRSRAEPVTLWSGILGPPIIWAGRFGISYVLASWACVADAMWLLHAITIASLAGVGVLGWLSWHSWRASREPSPAEPGPGDDRQQRVRFMALFGLFSSALFAVVIIAEGLANVLIDPCLTAGPLLP